VDAVAPDLVLRYLRELSADQLGGVVLDARGNVLAGATGVGAAAKALLDAAPADARELAVAVDDGTVYGVRDADRAVIVACTRHSLEGLVLSDLRGALGDLAGGVPPDASVPWRPAAVRDGNSSEAARGAAQRLVSAAQSGSAA
jgi:hypothetical protein